MDGTIVFNQLLNDQEVKNVTVWSNFPTDPTDLQAMADILRTRWGVSCVGVQSPQWSLQSVTFIYNESLPIYSVEVPFTGGVLTGSNPAGPLTTQVALLISTRYLGAPPNRGRIYFGGLNEGSTGVNNRFFAGAIDPFVNMVESWANGVDYGSNIAYLRIARRNADGTIDITSPVSSVIGRDVPATQRKRRIGVGA